MDGKRTRPDVKLVTGSGLAPGASDSRQMFSAPPKSLMK